MAAEKLGQTLRSLMVDAPSWLTTGLPHLPPTTTTTAATTSTAPTTGGTATTSAAPASSVLSSAGFGGAIGHHQGSHTLGMANVDVVETRADGRAVLYWRLDDEYHMIHESHEATIDPSTRQYIRVFVPGAGHVRFVPVPPRVIRPASAAAAAPVVAPAVVVPPPPSSSVYDRYAGEQSASPAIQFVEPAGRGLGVGGGGGGSSTAMLKSDVFVTCTRCGRVGHAADRCESTARAHLEDVGGGGGGDSHRGRDRDRDRDRHQDNISCFQCGQKGHTRAHCPQKKIGGGGGVNNEMGSGRDRDAAVKEDRRHKNIQCHGCGQWGHRQASCPEKARQQPADVKREAEGGPLVDVRQSTTEDMAIRQMRDEMLSEAQWWTDRRGAVPTTGLWCSRCGRDGHESFECRSSPSRKRGADGVDERSPAISPSRSDGRDVKRAKRENDASEVTCRACGKRGHRRRDCPGSRRGGGGGGGGGSNSMASKEPCRKCGKPGHIAMHCDDCQRCHLKHKKGKCTACFNCNQIGHQRKDCPQQDKRSGVKDEGSVANVAAGSTERSCHECGQPGHLKKQCPRLQSQNAVGGPVNGGEQLCHHCKMPGHLKAQCPMLKVNGATNGVDPAYNMDPWQPY